MKKMMKIFAMIFSVLVALPQLAFADYVGEFETTKYFDAATIKQIQDNVTAGKAPFNAGELVTYIIQFTPTDNGGGIGAGSFMTDYIPAGTQVVGAQFVHLNSDGTYYQIAPPTPAAVFPDLLPMYTDTGIFYSTDARTAMYTSDGSKSISNTVPTPSGNGYALATPGTSGCNGISLPSTTHNVWDSVMYKKFYNVSSPGSGGTCTAPNPAFKASSYNTSGLSPVAGPDTFLTLDSTGVVGPWQRIAYQGSLKGSSTGVAVAGINSGTAVTNACVGGVDTTAGTSLSVTNPLPANTNAVRFAAGKVTVGELFSVTITLKLLANMPSLLINNSEVFGGDVGLNMGNAGSHPSNWNQWHYDCPAVAISTSQLMVLKTLVGACVPVSPATTCTPSPISAGVVPSAANLRLRYQIQYLNLTGTAQTLVVLTDTLATQTTLPSGSAGGATKAAYVTNSYVLVSGTGAATGTNPTGTSVLTFPIGTLGGGASGTIQYDVNVVNKVTDGAALINTANLVSKEVPAPGVTSKAIATVSSQANLWITKMTATPIVASGGTVSYTITIPNNGAANATSVVVTDYLPSILSAHVIGAGATANDRFVYSSVGAGVTCGFVAPLVTLVAGQGCITTAAGVGTAVTLGVGSGTVATVAPYATQNREQVTFTLPTATAIPMFGKLTITFSATLGSNVGALNNTTYTNDANVWYAGGPGGSAANSSYSETIGTAPVTVSSVLTLSKKVNCVYSPATSTTCASYTGGAIVTGSKIKYELDYKNVSGSTLTSLVMTDTLPAGTSFVKGSANTATQPTVVGQVLTFNIASLVASATGTITFDVDASTVATGTDITNTANLIPSGYTAGVTASVTSSIRDQVLSVVKSVSPTSAPPGGTVTYTIKVTNVSNTATVPVVANTIQIYDELPYDTAVITANNSSEFTYAGAVTGSFLLTEATPTPATANASNIAAVTPTSSTPPTFTGYTGFTNQQEVFWNFGSKQLAPGASFTFSYTATVGSAVPVSVTTPATGTTPASTTTYKSDVQVTYNAAYAPTPVAMTTSLNRVADVTVGALDHIEIDHTGSGLTCQAPTVTVKACADSACATLYTGATTVVLSPGGASVSTGSTGTAIGTVSQTSAGTVTLGATASPAPISATPTTCVNTTAITAAAKISCSFKFDDAGFTIYVPNRVAGTINPDVTIDALTKATTGTCTGAFPANIAQPVHLYTTYSNPTSGTKSVTVTTGTVSTTSPGTVHNLTFNAAGRATTALYYPDVGQVTLNATGTAPNGVAMSSTGGSFVVKPGGFVLSNIVQTASPNTMNPAATSATGTKFVKAGEQFSVTVTATTCMPGVTNCISPTAVPQATPNFGLESPAESVKLNSTLVTGLGLTDIPAIASVTGFTSFTGGVSTGTDFSWPEVGIVTLTPSLKSGNYLSVAGDTAGTVSGNVGRFYAASLGVTSGSITNRTDFSCTSPCIAPDAFTYMGESMSAVFTLTALALDGTTRLQNYVDTFAKLDPTATASLNFGAIDTATTRTPLTSRISTTGLPAATGKFSSTCTTSPACLGTAKVTAPLTITRGASADGPYAALTVGIVPQDSDGATVKFDLDTTNLTATTSDHASVGSTAVRYGQLKFANAYGSELLSLSMPVYAQYWNGLAYANNTQDNQTSFASTNVTFGNYSTSTLTATNYPNSGTTAITPASVVFSSGTSNLTLAKPGRGNVGSVDLTCSYLSYLPTNNAGRATFGIYKNNGSIIYMRENY